VTGVAPDPADDPRRRERALAGRRDGGAGGDEAGVADRPGGMSGGDAHGRGDVRDDVRDPFLGESDAGPEVPSIELVRVRSERHRIEEVFEAAGSGVGPARYAVRSRVGWHHDVTRSLSAWWFLCCERRRIGGKTPAVAVSQVREVFARLLRVPAPRREGSLGR
jgi:hypothetical protein